jgi:peptide/nickel transport system ATP-binding protein
VLRALCGLNPDWRGEISIDGRPAPRRPDKDYCRTVQIVFQDPYGSLHPRQTVDRCLREPLEIQGIGERDRRVVDTLQAVGLNQSFRYRYPHQLSGGQRQRVGIARALMLEPKLLFLDEPTSALDVSVQAEILNLLVRLRKERGFTYVLVTHDLSIISHMCDRLIVMNVGRVVESMPVSALRDRTPENPYTQQLLQASLGYDRQAVERYQTFD